MLSKEFDPNSAALEGSGIYGLPSTLEDSRVVLIPVPVEITTSYGGGTAKGPDAILKASRQVDLYDASAGRVYEAGITMLAESPLIRRLNRQGRRLAQPIIEKGGEPDGSGELESKLRKVNEIGGFVNDYVYSTAVDLLAQNKIVGVVGGDHSVPFGLIRACAEQFPHLGVLHFDAHHDLRIAYEGFEWSHASIMFNVIQKIPQVRRLVQVGIRDFCEQEMKVVHESKGRIVAFRDEDLQRQKFQGKTWSSRASRIVSALPRNVYVSFDIDGLNASLCPHTGTPVPGGLSFEEAVYLIAAVARSGRRIVGFDLNEVAPGAEGGDWDANVGARLLYKLIGHTLLSQTKRKRR
ncbi:MAG: agmatinase family protein [Acidobacteriia bacterium]|nr:agmatinase family protein [Terriglobia bacterium]